MNRSWQRCFVRAVGLLAIAALAASCGQDPTIPPPKEEPAKQQLILTRVGSGAFEAHPGEPFTLTALLSISEQGPVADAQIKWRATQRPGEIKIETDTATTNGDGVAQVTVTCVDEGEFLFRADSAGAASKAVWKIDCRQPLRYLRIVEQKPVVTVTDAPLNYAASAVGAVNATIQLTVVALQRAGEREVTTPNQRIAFQVSRSVAGTAIAGSTNPAYQEVITSATGTASVQLKVGSTTGSVIVLATWGDLPPVQFDVGISVDPNTPCVTSAQCGANMICRDGTCQTRTGGPGSNDCGASDRGCPLGYQCVTEDGAKICKPIDATTCDQCPEGFTCDQNTQQCTKTDPDCHTDAECPNGRCRNGVCYPDNPGNVIDASGHWYTKHDFNIKDALPGWVQFGGTAIRVIDQVILGQLNIPSWANALIRGIVNQYIPAWVRTLVYLLDNLLTIFSSLRSEGEMDLTPVGGPALLAGEEYWSSFVFYLLSQCGENIGGDPAKPPPCARVDIYTTELEAADLAIDVRPFTAKVLGPNNGPYNIVFDRREARMKLAGIIKYMLDLAIQVTTGYESLEGPPGRPEEGALYNLVDCPGIGAQLMGAGLPFDVTPLCQAAVVAAAQALADQLRNQVITNDVLSFYGQAAARPDPAGLPNYATELGWPDFETRSTADGQWTGRFSIGVSVKNVPGRWRASREPILVTP